MSLFDDLDRLVREAKIVILAAAFMLLSAGFCCGVAVTRWVGN